MLTFCNFILVAYSGSIRLTPEGTIMHKSNPKDFTEKLLQEISIILPVDPDRLKSEGPTQIDTSTQFEQLIIPLTIGSTRNLTMRNADNLRKDLDIMIKHRRYTGLDMKPHTSQLDEDYGFKR